MAPLFLVLGYKKRCEEQQVLLKLLSPKVKYPLASLISYRKTIPNEQEVRQARNSPTENIIRMERVRYADSIPLVYEVASIPEKIYLKNF